MPDRMIAERTSAQPHQIATTDTNLETAALQARERPERAAELAADLGIRTESPSTIVRFALARALRAGEHAPRTFRPGTDDKPVTQALRGEPFLSADPSCEDPEQIPPGAFEAGLVRAMALEGYRIAGNGTLMREIGRSRMLARHLSTMMTALRDDDLDGVVLVFEMLARDLFFAGWLEGADEALLQRLNRKTAMRASNKGSLDELVNVFLTQIHLGAVNDDALLSRGYWTQEQVDQARAVVRGLQAQQGGAQ